MTSWPGSWKSSGSLPEQSTAAGPLLQQVLGPLSLDLQSMTPFYGLHYSHKIARLFPNIMLYAFVDRLFRKLCGHIRRISTQSSLTRVTYNPYFEVIRHRMGTLVHRSLSPWRFISSWLALRGQAWPISAWLVLRRAKRG